MVITGSPWERKRGKGWRIFFIGSTAEDIVNHVKMPIWTLALK